MLGSVERTFASFSVTVAIASSQERAANLLLPAGSRSTQGTGQPVRIVQRLKSRMAACTEAASAHRIQRVAFNLLNAGDSLAKLVAFTLDVRSPSITRTMVPQPPPHSPQTEGATALRPGLFHLPEQAVGSAHQSFGRSRWWLRSRRQSIRS